MRFADSAWRRACAILADVRKHVEVPVLTDVHAIDEIAAVAQVVDVLQTPAFLVRQTDFIQAVATRRQAGQHQEGPVPGPRGHDAGGEEGQGRERHRQHHGLRARRVVRLSQPRVRHALARDHARDGLPGGVRRHAFGAAAGRAGHAHRRPARIRAGAGALGHRRGRGRRVHGNAPGSGQGVVRRSQCVAACRACASCSRRWWSSTLR